MLNPLTAPDRLQNCVLLVLAVRWDQDSHRLADCFPGQITEEPLRTFVPTCDRAIEVLAYYRVITELDDRRKPHALKEGLDVTLLNDLLQSRLVILSRPHTPPLVKSPSPVSIFRGEVRDTASIAT
jgi:hypothetical protein